MADPRAPFHPLGSVSSYREGEHWEVDGATGCWNWTRSKDARGYGGCTHGKAHRVVWVQLGHELPDDHDLHHRCHNTSCVNPDHPEPVTRSEHLRAHKQFDSDLNWDDVRDLREAYARGGASIQELAERYGLGKSQIHNIVMNVKWHDPDFTPGRVAVCALEECRAEFIARRSHQRFCCFAHGRLWNSRRTNRRSRGVPLDGPSKWWKGDKDAA